MIRSSSHMLNAQENIMTSGCVSSPYPCEAVSHYTESQQVMIDNFVFSHMYNADIHIDAKLQCSVRLAAFSIVDDKHYEIYKHRIENKFFHYYDQCGDVVRHDRLREDACCHHFVFDAERVIKCIKEIESAYAPQDRGNLIIFYPYLKQLREGLKLIQNSFVCCSKTINSMQMYINELISHCLLFIEKLETINKTVKVMNLFMDNLILYECNVCKEVSTDERFLKPKECCEYAVCNACCVIMWKTATNHAKCPACRTSYKSLN
ncbi:IE-0 protein [Thysanoplusia orichalcea nucleopolyhedrovirus]|uniref:IE-0 protein n=1 Tax=Thysanoplusia orichalcea nucleopolyhedrovirus TaxID=101850 RepID=L0CLT6_9ABAC|nr:IE-0 protein [Thysanoplusia orichalcea nucleopolyhedrovirus]AGA16288.1 IE-0 protein [Thysanoplusia orichalcea nucleopolyhedrovirus]